MTNSIIDQYVKNHSVYFKDGWYWVIDPDTNEWVVNVAKSGYIFFNRYFWKTFTSFYPINDSTDNIKNWVVYRLNVPVSKHCYPDYIPGDYDWRDEFEEDKIIDVITNGELIDL